jgi:hypothetical protein
VHAILALANPDIPMHDDPLRVLPVLEDFFLQEVQVVDSLPLEEFSAFPPLSCVTEPKVISLLSFCSSDSFRELSNTLPVLDFNLHQSSTVLKVSRFCALAVTAIPTFPSQTCY